MGSSKDRVLEHDRNFTWGGRSFYFFDLDENILSLQTPQVLFHRETSEEVLVPGRDWHRIYPNLGKDGEWKNFEARYDDVTGSFRNFRDRIDEKTLRKNFLCDVEDAIKQNKFNWRGPSWDCFYHACYNQRPVSLITARGHHPSTIVEGLQLLVSLGVLPVQPNYLTVFPVNHPEIRTSLTTQSEEGDATPQLKRWAIRKSVETAFERYGYNPHHRFGMSDDDPRNVEMIKDEFTLLKQKYPEIGFFLFETSQGLFKRHEIFQQGIQVQGLKSENRQQLFDFE